MHRFSGIAAVTLAAVIGSLLTAVTPAHAAESTLASSRAAISASVDHGTYTDDILSGKITVEQLVDVTMDLRSTGTIPNAGPIPDRAELTRKTAEAITHLRAAAAPPAAPELTPSTGAHRATNPLVEDKHWWSHWFGFKLNAALLAGIGGTGALAAGVIIGMCIVTGFALCAGILFVSAAGLLALIAGGASCLGDHHAYVYVSVPNFKASGCRD